MFFISASLPSLQLSLFDLIHTEEQQRETVQRAAQEIFGAAFSMPQQVIDEVLCDGTNDRNSVIEICIEFSKDKSLADKAQFLRNLYKSDGIYVCFNIDYAKNSR